MDGLFQENPIYKLDDLGYLGVPPFMESSICESPKLGPGICGLSPGEQCGALVLAGGSWLGQLWGLGGGVFGENHGKILVFMTHDGFMVLLYMVTWIPSIYPSHVSIYTSTMDPMGEIVSWVQLEL